MISGLFFCARTGVAGEENFHYQYDKRILRENELQDIRWHDMRSSYCTLCVNPEDL